MPALRAVGAGLASLLMLAACSGAGGQQGSGGDSKTLIQVISGDPATLNPALTTGNPDLAVGCKIFEGLIRLDDKLQVQPGLAERWEISDDQLTYTFHLREAVKWHDGKPFTADDVVWTYTNVTSKFHPRSGDAFGHVSSIEATDDRTVVIKLAEPYGPFLPLLTCSNAAVLPKHVYGDAEGDEILRHPRNKENPVGTGPFKFESWKTGRQITLTKNKDYWRSSEGMPYLDRVILQPMSDAQSAAAALEAGEVDVITDYTLDIRTFDRLKGAAGIKGRENTNFPANYVLIFNTTKAPFDDARVRQAVAFALDRDFIVEKVFLGYSNPGVSAIDTRIKWAHNPNIDYRTMYPHNPARAEELLDAAGYRRKGSGERFAITVPFTSEESAFNDVAQILRDHLGKVGITVKLEPLERAVMLKKVFAEKNFDATVQRYTTLGDPAIGIKRLYVSSAIGKQPFTNASGYSNLKVDELFRQGESVAGYDERAKPYFEVQEILARDLPTLVLNENPTKDLVREQVEGMWKAPDSMEWWETVSIASE
ncbi:ABC transporter substrate-binding protein [Micromonospora sp. NPDC048830]|uniref:ABC transporter substrate-binding protein n=1 Tax=Micromonospora sp. NPDC048830 TaxID=3364257 RepID=UPI00371D3097